MPEFKVRKFTDRVGLVRVRQADGRLRYDRRDGSSEFSKYPDVWDDAVVKRLLEDREDVKEIE